MEPVPAEEVEASGPEAPQQPLCWPAGAWRSFGAPAALPTVNKRSDRRGIYRGARLCGGAHGYGGWRTG